MGLNAGKISTEEESVETEARGQRHVPMRGCVFPLVDPSIRAHPYSNSRFEEVVRGGSAELAS